MNFINVAKQRGQKELNVLLLGEAGSGKSTTVNAIANYFKYANFQEALQGEPVELIPSQIELIHPTTRQQMIIKSAKSDDNERMTPNLSSTKSPKTYVFTFGQLKLRLIDTPGIGDTAGIDQDKENFKLVLGHLQTMRDLHGICILLKSNETRITEFFKYCVAELLTQFHKSACMNIVVCFTFSRNCHFKPGDGFFALSNFLRDELPEVNLQLKPDDNCFFIDNEAFRFLLIKNSGKYPFEKAKEVSFLESWTESVNQINSLLENLLGIAPHDLENTISLNCARNLIFQLAEPIVRLQTTLDSNRSHIENKESELNDKTKNKMELAKNLNIFLDFIEATEIDYPEVRCTSYCCTDLIDTDYGKSVHYKTKCHKRCYLEGVSSNLIGDSQLQRCVAMNPITGICSECGCPWQAHKYVTFEYKLIKKPVICHNQKIKIDNEVQAIEAISQTLVEAQTLEDELEEEIVEIKEISVTFAYILKEHSNTLYNKFYSPYLRFLIKKEQNMITDHSIDKLSFLENLLSTHTEQVTLLQNALKSKSLNPILIEDIFNYRHQLTSLKHSGSHFEDIFNNCTLECKQNAKQLEVTVDYSDPPTDETFSENWSMSTHQASQMIRGALNAEKEINFINVAKQRGQKELNVLLLGETGSGKSTTVNAIANYFKYANFQEALNGELVELIPSQIEMIHPNTRQQMIIKSAKSDDNERMTPNLSSTKFPKTYVFTFGQLKLRLIDTPGIGDTTGIDQDKENFKLVLGHLQTMRDLHGICILLKSNETRITEFFKYCVAELLTQFHKSACMNIVVCFTFSRNCHFKPGDGFFAFDYFLRDELPEVNRQLKPNDNCFFIDNEAYRFLLIKNSGMYPFENVKEAGYLESWTESVNQINNLLENLLGIAPHDLANTISLNCARNLIFQLAEPIVMLQTTLDSNRSHIENKESELMNRTQNKMELAKHFNVIQDLFEVKKLDYPTVSCTSDCCTHLIDTDAGKKVHYKKKCYVHKTCSFEGIIIGDSQLQHCPAMDPITGICQECGCHWQTHKNFTFDYKIVKSSVICQTQKKKIDNEDDAIEAINQTLGEAQTLEDELEEEMEQIKEIKVKFANILKEHSNTLFNKFFSPYLRFLIKNEQKMITDHSLDKLTFLENLLSTHNKQVTLFQNAIKSKSLNPIAIEDIFNYRHQLTSLKHSGSQFVDIFNNFTLECKQNAKKLEVTVDYSDPPTDETFDKTLKAVIDELGQPMPNSVNNKPIGIPVTPAESELAKIKLISQPENCLKNIQDNPETLTGLSIVEETDVAVIAEYNILLFGETGTGKSTTINAIANYLNLNFDCFEEADKHNFLELVSSKFTLSHPETYWEFPVVSGEMVNEMGSKESSGQSRTQSPKEYRIEYRRRILRIIDTPGMGDTRGLKVDKENIDKIFGFLRGYEHLHGIIILLKSTETRQLASFQYCLTELLSHLHKSATRNLFFCFTFARNSFYAPGDAFMIVKRFLADEFMGIGLRSGENCFFIDNEAYRYLVAKKCGYPFEPNSAKSFAESWNKSALQVSQMIMIILHMKPHNLKSTFALNDALHLLSQLAQPMVELQLNIRSNLKTIQMQRDDLTRSGKEVERWKNYLKAIVKNVDYVSFSTPNTVCTSPKCTQVLSIEGENRVHYGTVCCHACQEKKIPDHTPGHPLLKCCKAFSTIWGHSNNCQGCGCPLKQHMHIQNEYRITEHLLISGQEREQLVAQLKSGKLEQVVSEKIVKVLTQLCQEYEHEVETIQKVAASFAYFLDENSNLKCNRFIEHYLDLLIEEEEQCIRKYSDYQIDELVCLMKLKERHLEIVKQVTHEIQNEEITLNLSKIHVLIDMLNRLKHCGPIFKDDLKKIYEKWQ